MRTTILITALLLAGCARPTDPAPRVEPMSLHEWHDGADAHDRDTFQDTLQRSEPKDDSLDCRWDELDKDQLPLSPGGL